MCQGKAAIQHLPLSQGKDSVDRVKSIDSLIAASISALPVAANISPSEVMFSISALNRSTLAVVVGAGVVVLEVVNMVFMRSATVLVPFFDWSL